MSDRQAFTSTERQAFLQLSSGASLFFLVYKRVGFTLPTRLCPSQREEGEAQITYFDEHSMQSGLVNDWAGEDGFSIVHHGDGQPIKPLRPFTVKMPLDDDLVDLLSNVFAFHSVLLARLLARSPSREPLGQPFGTLLISNPFERGILWGHPITCPPGRVPRQRAAALCTPADFHHSSAGVDIIHLCGGCGLCRLRRQSPHPPHNSCELPEAVRSQEEHDLKSYRN